MAYTTQRDTTMAHSTLYTGIRVARPGLEQMAANTTESVAGYRWDGVHVYVPGANLIYTTVAPALLSIPL